MILFVDKNSTYSSRGGDRGPWGGGSGTMGGGDRGPWGGGSGTMGGGDRGLFLILYLKKTVT